MNHMKNYLLIIVTSAFILFSNPQSVVSQEFLISTNSPWPAVVNKDISIPNPISLKNYQRLGKKIRRKANRLSKKINRGINNEEITIPNPLYETKILKIKLSNSFKRESFEIPNPFGYRMSNQSLLVKKSE